MGYKKLIDRHANDEKHDEGIAGCVEIPTANLDSAAAYITRLLEAHGHQYAVMGGYALMKSGSERPTDNIDVCIAATMPQVAHIVSNQARLVVPDMQTSVEVLRLYVRTGKSYDGTCPETHLVEVEMILAGALGTPRELTKHTQEVRMPQGSSNLTTTSLRILGVEDLMRHKLIALVNFGGAKALHDAGFIVERFPSDIRAVQWTLAEEFSPVGVSPFDFMLCPPTIVV